MLAVLLVAAMVGGSLLFAMPQARAPLLLGAAGFSATPGLYSHPGLPRHPYLYVPGEVLTFQLTSDTPGEIYDAPIIVQSTGVILRANNNVTIPPGLTLTLTYTIPANLTDGPDYAIEIGPQDYIENGRPFFLRFRLRTFAVQAYELRLEVDRAAYLGGDDVIVTWSAKNLKDGAFAPDGFGQLWVYDASGTSLITPGVHTYAAASGSFGFTVPDLADPALNAVVQSWFNDTTSNPIRFQQAFWFFAIDSLGVITDVSPNQYPPGGIVTVDVTTLVSFDQTNPSPFDPPEPDINVDITVWEIPAAGAPIEHPLYAETGLVTDTHGRLTYVFKLDDNVLGTATSKNFEANASASHRNGIWQWEDRDSFTVNKAAGMSMVLEFNQDEYQADDTATVTAIVMPPTPGLTYAFEVRDTTSTFCTSAFPTGALLATDTRSTNSYSYQIPRNFEGNVCFRVTADDGAGNQVVSAREFPVVFGWLLVNSNVREYNPGQTVTISWELASNRITTPTYFYEVTDADGNLVDSGTTGSARSFNFAVPDPASRFYDFTVTATQEGRTIAGAITLTEISGFFITITFDRSSYAPGDTMDIYYRITARGDAALPSTFTLTYGLTNGPAFGGSFRVVSTASDRGSLAYTVPAGIDEGLQPFQVFESNTFTQATEIVTIRGTNPAWFATLGDVPVLVVIMLLWLILMTLMLWRKGVLFGTRAPRAPKPEAPKGPSPSEPVYAPATSPMTVTCRSCGSPIEITTSKRPIEVMCPKCGNTEMVS